MLCVAIALWMAAQGPTATVEEFRISLWFLSNNFENWDINDENDEPQSMFSEWKVQLGEPKFAMPQIASLQAASPRNSHSPESIGIFVSLWCGRDVFDLSPNSGDWLSYGFRIGEVQVEVKGGVISHEGRFKQEFLRERVDQIAKRSAASGALAPESSQLEGSLAFKGNNISRGSQFVEEKRGEYFRVVWRVADAAHNTWRVFGDGLNHEGVLENRLIGDDPLFFVEPHEDIDEIRVTVSYFVDLFGLWVDETFRGDGTNGADGGLRARQAVSAAILAKALRKSGIKSGNTNSERLVLLCQQRLTATKRKSESGQ